MKTATEYGVEMKARQEAMGYFEGLNELEALIANIFCNRDNLTEVEIWGLKERSKEAAKAVTEYLQDHLPDVKEVMPEGNKESTPDFGKLWKWYPISLGEGEKQSFIDGCTRIWKEHYIPLKEEKNRAKKALRIVHTQKDEMESRVAELEAENKRLTKIVNEDCD